VVTADLAAGACEERSSTLIGSPPAALWRLPDDGLEKRACFLFLAWTRHGRLLKWRSGAVLRWRARTGRVLRSRFGALRVQRQRAIHLARGR